ncbi:MULTISPECIES: hypothetical protein [Asticcacaulis]|uniref:hypothetical protein n=1 Tax=Asticcacaulis TaxID=76890 RepID=UPI001AE78F0B|nr:MULTISPECIES: hypothetical protein [Asticcacaulis]MBP2159575.1 hypothetical protein [Asticcacaulis solisilvae]MDR6800598.1 hypothetical protein [Asticcacaulis sp. BE141]
MFEHGDDAEAFLKSLCHFAAPEAEEEPTITTENGGNIWDLINAHKEAFARRNEVAEATLKAPDYDETQYAPAARAEEVAAVELVAASLEGSQYVTEQVNSYYRTAEDAKETGFLDHLWEMPREPILALRAYYRANPAGTGQ